MTFSRQSDVDPIKSLILKHARDAFVSQETIDREWRDLNYLEPPDFERAVAEYDRFAELLRAPGLEVHWLSQDPNVSLDSLYARDASIVCRKGIILCHMGKRERRREPGAQQALFDTLGIPLLGRIRGEGRVEGGDVVWLDEDTLAVGRGYRTNDEGIRQLRVLLDGCVRELIVVPLPHWKGPVDVFHLMSIISPLDRDLALIYAPLVPVPFLEKLQSMGFELLSVPDTEFDTMGGNVLALSPRRCLMLAGNPETRARLETAGVTVSVFEGKEICMKGGGGPTCLTRPMVRNFADK